MSFITLTKPGGLSILINPVMITLMDILTPSNEHEPNTSVYIMGGGLCHVMETVDEIKKKINEASHIKLTTYETGPR